jgi:hypothetical protein
MPPPSCVCLGRYKPNHDSGPTGRITSGVLGVQINGTREGHLGLADSGVALRAPAHDSPLKQPYLPQT